MTRMIIEVEDESLVPHLIKIFNAMNGVSVITTNKKKKSGLEEAMEDIKAGRVTRYESAEDMFRDLGI